MPVEDKPNEIRVRIQQPSLFSEFRYDVRPDGINFLFGKRKDNGKWEIQAYRFDKKKWTLAKVNAWLNSHDIKPL